MKEVNVLVDLDDTIVDFSQFFMNKLNEIIVKDTKFSYIHTYESLPYPFTVDMNINYDYRVMLKQYMSESDAQYIFDTVLDSLFSDVNLYTRPIFTKEARKIFEMIRHCRIYECTDNTRYNITLHTKVNSYTMIESKGKLFNLYPELFGLFDRIIIDMEGVHSAKPTNYDILIDDSPKNIKAFLEENLSGKVYLPLRQWNKDFSNNERVEIL